MKSVYIKTECGLCGRVFMCHPGKVTKVTTMGRMLYVCRECVEHANRRRAERRLPLLSIEPGAYEPGPT